MRLERMPQHLADDPSIAALLADDRSIGRMAAGSAGWTVPWAVSAAADGHLWLNQQAPRDRPACTGHVPDSSARVGPAEQEQTVDMLKAAYVEGQLTLDELRERAGSAFAARTRQDLDRAADGLACSARTRPHLRAGRAEDNLAWPAGGRTPAAPHERRPANNSVGWQPDGHSAGRQLVVRGAVRHAEPGPGGPHP